MKKTIMIFVRHGESQKNLKDITGGDGEIITNNGLIQASNLSTKIQTWITDVADINLVASNFLQTIQTAKYIGNDFAKEVAITNMLTPAGMGVVAGLSGKEIELKYPAFSMQLKRWRAREIEANQLLIEGMERPENFWDRILLYLKSLHNGKTNIVVCTRSIMVLVGNLVRGHTPAFGGNYKHIDVGFCDTISFSVGEDTAQKYDIIKEWTSVSEVSCEHE